MQTHIFTCHFNQSHSLFSEFSMILNARYKQDYYWKFLYSQTPHISSILHVIGPIDNNFLRTHFAQGIITTNCVHEFINAHSSLHNLQHALDCWLSTFYQIVWSSRCQTVQNRVKTCAKLNRQARALERSQEFSKSIESSHLNGIKIPKNGVSSYYVIGTTFYYSSFCVTTQYGTQ